MGSKHGLALFSIVVETPLHIRGGARQGGIAYPLWRGANGNLPGIPGQEFQRAVWEIAQEGRADHDLMPSAVAEGGPDEKPPLTIFEDAEVALFPVRAACGVFAFITCPENLFRLKHWIMPDAGLHWAGLEQLSSGQVMVCPGSDLVLKNDVVLEEYRLSASVSPELAVLAKWMAEILWPSRGEYSFWQAKIERSLAVLSNEDYRYFVGVNTELRAVGGPFILPPVGEFEECLPADTMLLAHVLYDSEKSPMSMRDVLEILTSLGRDFVWLGAGNEDGQGMCRIKCLPLEGAQAIKFPLDGA